MYPIYVCSLFIVALYLVCGCVGTIPSSVGSLTLLTSLSLFSNCLSGKCKFGFVILFKFVPCVLLLIRLRKQGKCFEVADYNLGFIGIIPSSIGLLKSLLSCQLYGNKLSGK